MEDFMTKIHKLGTLCLIGSLLFTSNPVFSKAAELPITGRDIILHSFSQNNESINIASKEDLSTTILLNGYRDASLAQVTNFVSIQKTNKLSYRNALSDSSKSSNTLKLSSVKSEEEKKESIRDNIVEYALQFEGNPYVWGGTSLTRGADCSGFTQSVFRDNGISIPRTSRIQATGGKRVSIDNIEPGDLIFYEKRGTINHVALYIGNGKVISASSPSTGIVIKNYDYRQPYKAVSYID
jgi:cell wall-associated NlpC family hydrolase